MRDAAGADLVTYTYDANGNRTQTNTASNAYTSTYAISPTSNRLVSATYPHFTMGMDAAGNKTGDGNYALTYDLRGRLASLSIPNGSSARAPEEELSARSKLSALSVQSFTYTYDSAGLRVRKINSIGAGATLLYVYDQNQKLLGEYDANGNVLREYLWLDDMPIAVLTNDLGAWQALPIHADHLNTPRAVMDLDNIVRWSWFNPTDVFGKDYAVIDPQYLGAVYVNLRFPGQVYDGESGMHYNVNRDYVPSLGRYAQSDPIGLDGGINTYAYGEGNPLSNTDPLGLQSGGPYHQPEGVSLKCTDADSCPEIQGKLQQLKRMIDSHEGWDRNNPSPKGGGRHATEIADLWRAYARCQSLWVSKDCDNCKPGSFLDWINRQLGPKFQYDPAQEREVVVPNRSFIPILPGRRLILQ